MFPVPLGVGGQFTRRSKVSKNEMLYLYATLASCVGVRGCLSHYERNVLDILSLYVTEGDVEEYIAKAIIYWPSFSLSGLAYIKENLATMRDKCYSSHGHFSPWRDIKAKESTERGNYSPGSFKEWELKYGIGDDDMAIWVTDKQSAVVYSIPAYKRNMVIGLSSEEFDRYVADNEVYLKKIDTTKGVFISESDDGDYGLLFVERGDRKA